jgi:hypothetical protein
MHARWKATAAGAAATVVWGLLEPLDMRLARHDYSDIAVLGKAFTRGPAWRPLGFAIHAENGAMFGFAFHEVRRRVPIDERKLALAMALIEHVALFPLGALADRYHPARGEPGVAKMFHPRAFAQATLRHTLFGLLLGRLGAENRSSRRR